MFKVREPSVTLNPPDQKIFDAINLKVGSDPEFFLFDKAKGRIVPAVGLVPGTKHSPHLLHKGSVQVDGTLVEIGIDPASSEDEFVENHAIVLEQVRELLGPRYELHCGSLGAFHDDEIASLDPIHLKVGCDPEFRFSSIDSKVMHVSKPDKLDPKRIPAGGHIHIGFTEEAPLEDVTFLRDCRKLHEQLSSVLPPIVERTRHDVMYGTYLSTLRIKPYGIEFRAPDSYWTCTEDTVRGVYRVVQESVKLLVGTRGWREPRATSEIRNISYDMRDLINFASNRMSNTVPVF